MDAVVSSVRLRVQAKLLPAIENRAADGALRGRSRVRGTEDLASEVGPAEGRGGPGDREPLDGRRSGREDGAHLQVEAVDDEELALGIGELAAVETATKLDESLTLLESAPEALKSISIQAEPRRGTHGVQHEVLLQRRRPGHAESFLERRLSLRGNIQLIGLLLHCALGDRAVVSVDEELLIDLLSLKPALGDNGDAMASKGLLHQALDLVRHGMGLDEHESRVDLVLGSSSSSHFSGAKR
mmetsp:Transcript_32817/g.94891  ORF Transcript_32817/g.94891 Transcript_32817/m.94891 type:complete len:242 (-) Transcript_32817:35-760(-)